MSNLDSFNGLNLTVKTDGNPYTISLLFTQAFNSEVYTVIYIQARIIDRSKQFVELELPLSNFSSFDTGYMRKLGISSDSGNKLVGIMIELSSDDMTNQGLFEFSIKDVKFINKPELDDLALKYPYNIFFKTQENYSSAKYLDNGMSLVSLK